MAHDLTPWTLLNTDLSSKPIPGKQTEFVEHYLISFKTPEMAISFKGTMEVLSPMAEY